MVDACIVDRPNGETLNTTTGQMVTTYVDVYTGLLAGGGGKCRVQQVGTQALSPNAGEHQFTVIGHVVQLPVGATVYRVGDRVRITLATLDPALAGCTFIVSSWVPKTHDTMRRLVCDEVLG